MGSEEETVKGEEQLGSARVCECVSARVIRLKKTARHKKKDSCELEERRSRWSSSDKQITINWSFTLQRHENNEKEENLFGVATYER